MMDRSQEVRRLHACIVILLSYLLLAWLVVVVFWVSTGFGEILAEVQRGTLRIALVGHTAAIAVVGLVYGASRSAGDVPPWISKAVLALMPFVLLVSIDRLAAVSFPPPEPPGILIGHPTRGWTNQHGFVEQLGEREFRLNAHGLRGPDIDYEKADGEVRIVFLGDSITFGTGVDEDDVFVRQVERRFAQDPDGPRVTTINCGVTGYSPWQELDLLRTECIKYAPDLVVQVFCLNDVGEKYELRRFGGLSWGFEPEPRTPVDWSGLYQAFRYSVADWITGTKAKVADRRARYSVERLLREPSAPEFVEAWASMLVDFSKMQEVARAKGARLAIVCFPFAEQLSPFKPYEDAPQHRLRAFAEQRQIPFLDLTPMYRAYCRRPEVLKNTGREWEGLALFPDQVHPTAEGHLMAAKAMYRWIRRILWPEDVKPDGGVHGPD